MSPELIIGGIAVATVLIWCGITVGLFYAHVAECARFRLDMIARLERIENNQMANARPAY